MTIQYRCDIIIEASKGGLEYAGVAELADALVSGSSEAIHVGSSPVTCTRVTKRPSRKAWSFCFNLLADAIYTTEIHGAEFYIVRAQNYSFFIHT